MGPRQVEPGRGRGIGGGAEGLQPRQGRAEEAVGLVVVAATGQEDPQARSRRRRLMTGLRLLGEVLREGVERLDGAAIGLLGLRVATELVEDVAHPLVGPPRSWRMAGSEAAWPAKLS